MVVGTLVAPHEGARCAVMPRLYPPSGEDGVCRAVRAHEPHRGRLDGSVEDDRVPSSKHFRGAEGIVVNGLPAQRLDLAPPRGVLLVARDDDMGRRDIIALALTKLVLYLPRAHECVSTSDSSAELVSCAYFTRRSMADIGAKQSSGFSAIQHQLAKSP